MENLRDCIALQTGFFTGREIRFGLDRCQCVQQPRNPRTKRQLRLGRLWNHLPVIFPEVYNAKPNSLKRAQQDHRCLDSLPSDDEVAKRIGNRGHPRTVD